MKLLINAVLIVFLIYASMAENPGMNNLKSWKALGSGIATARYDAQDASIIFSSQIGSAKQNQLYPSCYCPDLAKARMLQFELKISCPDSGVRPSTGRIVLPKERGENVSFAIDSTDEWQTISVDLGECGSIDKKNTWLQVSISGDMARDFSFQLRNICLFDKEKNEIPKIKTLNFANPAKWSRRSVGKLDVSAGSSDGELEFSADFNAVKGNHWLFPAYSFSDPSDWENSAGIMFEIRLTPNCDGKFSYSGVRLLQAKNKIFKGISFDPPSGNWERRIVRFPKLGSDAALSQLVIGGLAQGKRLSYQLRNIKLFLK